MGCASVDAKKRRKSRSPVETGCAGCTNHTIQGTHKTFDFAVGFWVFWHYLAMLEPKIFSEFFELPSHERSTVVRLNVVWNTPSRNIVSSLGMTEDPDTEEIISTSG